MAIIDVIKFNGIANRDWLVYRFPGEDFVYGTKLIVGEGQVAVFVKGGKAIDYFEPGTYTLNAQNLPILQSIINVPFGGRTPFTAEVIFINKTSKLDVLWGTSDPITMIDCKYAVKLRVRAFGQFAMRISDYPEFLTKLIGSMGDSQIVKYDLVVKYFKGAIVTNVKTIIADILINQKISVLEVTPRLADISNITRERLDEKFKTFGIEIIDFNISSINFPDEDFEEIDNILKEKAAFEIIGDNRYNVKRSFDVMQTAAGNEGGGNLASAGIGIGIGAGAGMAVGKSLTNATDGLMNSTGRVVACKKCGMTNSEGVKFCSNCGAKMTSSKIECFSCKALVEENAKFCPNCGTSLIKGRCKNCGTENLPGAKFCTECGTHL